MDKLIITILICIAIPLTFSLLFLNKDARLFVTFMIIGGAICTFATSVNTLLVEITGQTYFYITTNVTPISEELLKAIPVLLYGYAISDDKSKLLSISMAMGIGFAIVENLIIFAQNDNNFSIAWAIGRVFGASLMHGICTLAVGHGISFVRKKKKLFYTGTFALLVFAIVYHSIYNLVIQSEYSNFGILIPIMTYIPLTISNMMLQRKNSANVAKTEKS